MTLVIETEQLRKVYGATVALKGLSVSVKKGEIFGIVGPNGAGKTSALNLLSGLRVPDGGKLQVLGMDPVRQGLALRQRIGIQLQEAELPDRLKVWEALDLFSSFYERAVPWQPLMVDWGLEKKRNTAFGNLSGGQKQRLFIALALVNRPELVFLDELTTGLDPQARRQTWDLVREVRDRGSTVVQVTHFMEEAERLCDRVAVIDRGALLACDTPARLVADHGTGITVSFTPPAHYDPASLERVEGVMKVRVHQETVHVHGQGPLLARVAGVLAKHGIEPDDLKTSGGNLEDVFLKLTGHAIRS